MVTPKVDRSTVFHTDQTWRDVGKKGSIFARLSCLLNNLLPCSSIPWTWKTSFAKSMPIHDGRSAQVVTIYRPTVAQDVGGGHSINKALTLSDER